MHHKTFITSLVIQFKNPVQPPQYGAPVLISHVGVVVDGNGMNMYQPAYSILPAAPSDISEELLEQIGIQLAAVGLVASRAEATE